MARPTNKLSAKGVAALSDPGIYGDGAGLYLRISPSKSRSWVLIYRFDGRRREVGLGSAEKVTLAQARVRAAEGRAQVADGIDPVAARKAEKEPTAPKVADTTFGAVAEALVDTLEKGWKNAKHRQQWRNTLRTYAKPIWNKPAGAITSADLIEILEPIWLAKPETAVRVRARIEHVLDAAKVAGHREGENPARFRGHLALMLPSQKMGRKKAHHPAMPYADVPAFMVTLRGLPGMATQALEFTILTAARSGEALRATAAEIDLEAATWTIPAERMKMGVEHRVPLSPAAMDLARARLRGVTDPDAYVFPGARKGMPLSNMAMGMLLRREQFDDFTVHGFRSSFRDWCGEETEYPRELAEMSLAHAVGDEVERAYRRGDALLKRRALMDDWGRYVAG